jgi:biotin carboxylase
LILAASHYQLDVIRVARALGYTVFTTDNVPDNPGHRLAHRSFAVDTTDWRGVCELVERERLDGLIAACTDVAVPTAARVGERFGLPAPPVAATDVLCSKLGFRDFLAAHDLPRPAHHRITEQGLPADVFGRHPAWIIKPDRASGSKGVAIVRRRDELAHRFAEAAAFSANGEVVLEQFIDGVQGTCEGIVFDGRVQFHLVLDRQTAAPPYVATMGQCAPSRLSDGQTRRLVTLIDTVFARLAITHCVFDADFVCTGDEVFLIELAPRLGGNSISALVRAAYPGFDLVEYAVRLACGDPVPALPTRPANAAAVRILGSHVAGTLRYDPASVEALRREPWVSRLELDVPSGAAVRAFTSGRDRLGEAVIVAPERDELDARLGELDRRLALQVS